MSRTYRSMEILNKCFRHPKHIRAWRSVEEINDIINDISYLKKGNRLRSTKSRVPSFYDDLFISALSEFSDGLFHHLKEEML